MRDRLIELLEKAFEFYIDDPYCIPDEGEFADYLLANGVIVPPCKVGDVVYELGWVDPFSEDDSGFVMTSTVKEFAIFTTEDIHGMDSVGKTVFLTKEEAEQALKESEKV